MNIYGAPITGSAQTMSSMAEAGVRGQECEGVCGDHKNSSLAGGEQWGWVSMSDKFKLQKPFMVSSRARLWDSMCKVCYEKHKSYEMLKGFSIKTREVPILNTLRNAAWDRAGQWLHWRSAQKLSCVGVSRDGQIMRKSAESPNLDQGTPFPRSISESRWSIRHRLGTLPLGLGPTAGAHQEGDWWAVLGITFLPGTWGRIGSGF